MLATLLVMMAQAQAPLLELRTGAGWTAWRDAAPGSAATHEAMLATALSWTDSAPGLRSGSFEVRTADGYLRNSIALIELDPARFRFSLGVTAPDARTSAEDWLRADSTLVLTANTGLFRENGTPQGLVVVNGARHSSLAGWLDAVVLMDSAGSLRMTDVAGARAATPANAFQTLPWLVRDGRVAFGGTSGLKLSKTHRDRRITLCLGDDGLVRLMLSNFEVFGATAGRVPIGLTIPEQAALAAGLGCRDAVALDGGISSQIAFRTGTHTVRMPGWRRVPLMLQVRTR